MLGVSFLDATGRAVPLLRTKRPLGQQLPAAFGIAGVLINRGEKQGLGANLCLKGFESSGFLGVRKPLVL